MDIWVCKKFFFVKMSIFWRCSIVKIRIVSRHVKVIETWLHHFTKDFNRHTFDLAAINSFVPRL